MTLVTKTHVGRLGMFKVIKKIIQEDKKLVEKGDYYFKNGNYKNAIYYYRKALEINEDNEDAKRGIALIHEDILFRRGLKLFNLSDYSNAILEFEKLLKNIDFIITEISFKKIYNLILFSSSSL